MLELFAGRLGWAKAFLARGWEVTAVDLVEPPEIPAGVTFIQIDVMKLPKHFCEQFDFICASSPCEQFSVHGMKHFHPNPKFPEMGIKLFEHTRAICERSGVPFVMENVRAEQQFVGNAVNHAGPFYLWGSGVPPLMPQGLSKTKAFRVLPGNLFDKLKNRAIGIDLRRGRMDYQHKREREALLGDCPGGYCQSWSHSEARKLATAKAAEIPPELAACVADYAERITESVMA